ncbi:hypothetical protein SAMN02746066_03144 [Anaerosporobacter mobilis DSM 15930]|uniref:Uncharacterized protein n=1 Tax=Anaerosporobacter mobilis DSM 15930 TaxID=1120996 RepID=A0A1M7LCQ9_9FIRM|nr:hypothetical protein [Anaerosporobacter mobilis]SHM75142.1 hypothetical protein SAMN02746066_03144 [Anaerosporobacter mobilis DSM 15930]
MKKFGKFIAGTLSLAALVGGAFYFFKNVVNKDSTDDFDDFDDDFDDIEDDDTEDSDESETDTRGYVTLTMPEVSDFSDESIDTDDNLEAEVEVTLSDQVPSEEESLEA